MARKKAAAPLELPEVHFSDYNGVRCLHLSVEQLCQLFGQPERPAVCIDFKADLEVCGNDQADAIRLIGWWEQMTAA